MNPIAFTLFGLEIRWYGIFIAIGALLAIRVAEYLARRNPLVPEESIMDFALWGMILGILGARIYYVIFEWSYYAQHPSEILAIRNGGLAIHGGLIAGALVAYFFTKRKQIPFMELLDTVAPGVVLAQGIGRWGNFMNGEAHGGPTDLPWAITVDGVSVHPTFLYESLLDVGIFLLLFLYVRKVRKYPGQMSAIYLALYSAGRFFIEGLRTDSLYVGPFRTAQLLSLILLLVALFIHFHFRKQSHPTAFQLTTPVGEKGRKKSTKRK
ncbi:MAG: prolipoprotein diacylglyceryl transferase [Tissierellia bacterium]|nr:prolipoprotein diacylglyceryl transferase [Tissierellia bacterium]